MKTKLVIFGITGDLSRRKLLPALKAIINSGGFEDLSIVGVSRRKVDVRQLVNDATGSDELADLTTVFTMDLATAEDYVRLRTHLDPQEDEQIL